jgi:hypothetical protein
MIYTLIPRNLIIIALLLLSGCQTTSDQNAGFYAPLSSAQQRQLDSRRFDTSDEERVLTAIVDLLQDLGFKVGETNLQTGIISGSKGYERGRRRYGSDIRITATTSLSKTSGIVVRATFQDIKTSKAPRFYKGEPVTDPAVYRRFFDKLAQSLFLEAHSI